MWNIGNCVSLCSNKLRMYETKMREISSPPVSIGIILFGDFQHVAHCFSSRHHESLAPKVFGPFCPCGIARDHDSWRCPSPLACVRHWLVSWLPALKGSSALQLSGWVLLSVAFWQDLIALLGKTTLSKFEDLCHYNPLGNQSHIRF